MYSEEVLHNFQNVTFVNIINDILHTYLVLDTHYATPVHITHTCVVKLCQISQISQICLNMQRESIRSKAKRPLRDRYPNTYN